MKFFKLNEFMCRCGRCRMPPEAVQNIETLVDNVLDPARERLGPIVVNSGYRCPKHNREVGGVANSQHLKGEAADIAPVQGSGFTVKDLGKVIEEQGKYDQLIYYPNFIHVSWKRNGGNRRQKLPRMTDQWIYEGSGSEPAM